MLRNFLILCTLLIFVLTGCFTAAEQGNNPTQNLQQENAQLKRVVASQNQKIQTLQRENESLRNTRVVGQRQVDSAIVVQNLRVNSQEAYTEGRNAGAIYGRFDVAARIKNVSNTTRNNVKVIAVFQRTQRGNAQARPNTQTVIYNIPTLRANQTAVITFRGFRVDHPDRIQEVVVHPVGYNDVSKTTIRAAFPPDTQD